MVPGLNRCVYNNLRFLVLNLIAVFVLSIAIIFFVPGFVKNVSAAEPAPECLSGYIEDGGLSSAFKVSLNCSNVSGFAFYDEDATKANIQSLLGIEIHASMGGSNPFQAEIIGDQIWLTFYTDIADLDRDIFISGGTVLNSEGVSNSDIYVPTSNIEDKAIPVIVEDVYEIYGNELIVSVEDGVLINDFDGEGSVSNAELITDPEYGQVVLNPDGSFVYIRGEVIAISDVFFYQAYDENGNLNVAQVIINDPAAVIEGYMYRIGPLLNNKYAKVGDTVRVDFISTEAVTVDNIRIGDHNNLIPIFIDDYNFYATYELNSGDIEGDVNYTLTAYDSAGNITTVTTEYGIAFDKTKPVIDLNGGSDGLLIEIHNGYTETAFVIDNYDNTIELSISGVFDSDISGDYYLYYDAVDRSGNHADQLIRNVRIFDHIADMFDVYSDYLRQFDIENNLNEVTVDSILSFNNLFFEKSINGDKISRIEFGSSLDLSGDAIIDFFYDMNNRMTSDGIGSIGIDFADMADQGLVPFYNKNALITFYNLNKIGFTNKTRAFDVYSRLIVSDNDRNVINKTGIVGGLYGDYNYSISVDYVSSYFIDNYAPIVSVDDLGEIKIGQSVTFTGTIDDVVSRLYLTLGDYYIMIPDENIINHNWSYTFRPLFKRIGNYTYKVTAIDSVGNIGIDYGSLRVKNSNSQTVVFVTENSESSDDLVTETLGAQTSKDEENKTDSSSVNVIKSENNVDNSFRIAWYFKVLIFASFIIVIIYLIRIKPSNN